MDSTLNKKMYEDERSQRLMIEKNTTNKLNTSTKDDKLFEDEKPKHGKEMCVSLEGYTKKTQFLLLTAGIFFFYLLYGYFQELIFQLPGFKSYGWYLTLIQFALYCLFGKLDLFLRRDNKRCIPWPTYFFLAFLTLSTMGLSNTSVGYLNYPTQVVFKSCKLVPVLIGSIIIQGKKYSAIDFIAAGCMSIGLIFFTLADSNVSPKFDIIGVNMISLALVADAVIGNVQEKAMQTYRASNTEVVFYSYTIGFFYLLLGALAFGELLPAIQFCANHPIETYGYATIFSATGYFGINLVLTLIQVSGVFVAVTVTTFRKSLSIIISFVLFSKPFTIQYLWSGLLILLGIYLNLSAKMNIKWVSEIISVLHRLTKPFRRVCTAKTKIATEV